MKSGSRPATSTQAEFVFDRAQNGSVDWCDEPVISIFRGLDFSFSDENRWDRRTLFGINKLERDNCDIIVEIRETKTSSERVHGRVKGCGRYAR